MDLDGDGKDEIALRTASMAQSILLYWAGLRFVVLDRFDRFPLSMGNRLGNRYMLLAAPEPGTSVLASVCLKQVQVSGCDEQEPGAGSVAAAAVSCLRR